MPPLLISLGGSCGRYGVVTLSEKHGSIFLSSLRRHAEDSVPLSLFARLAEVSGNLPLTNRAVAINLAMEATNSLSLMGFDPTDDKVLLDQPQLEKLLRSVTVDAVIDELDLDTVWAKLRAARGEYEEWVQMYSIILVQRCARMMLAYAKRARERASETGETISAKQMAEYTHSLTLARSTAKRAIKKQKGRKPMTGLDSSKAAPAPAPIKAPVAISDEANVLAIHALLFVVEELPARETRIFQRAIAPALGAADVDRSGVLCRDEIGAFVRFIHPKVAEKAIARVWYKLHPHLQERADADDDDDDERAVVNVDDTERVTEVMQTAALRQLLRGGPAFAIDSSLFGCDGVFTPPLGRKRMLLAKVGSSALDEIDALWAEERKDAKLAAAAPKASKQARTAFAKRVESFEAMLERTREAISLPGGGDEKLVAVPLFAFHMVVDETRRLLGKKRQPARGNGSPVGPSPMKRTNTTRLR